jgi:RNA polymerase sigma factor (sigma-70 family)
MLTEEEIILRCIKRDRKAQKLLYYKYAAIMLGICSRYVADRTEAEDILQDGFLKIFLNIEEFESRGSFEGWMKRIMINTAITYYHKNLKYNQQLDIDEINETHIEGNDYETAEYTIEELQKVITSLPAGYRMVFNLFAIEGYKHKDIADMLGIDINTSKSQFSRARRLIQKKLEELKKIRNFS